MTISVFLWLLFFHCSKSNEEEDFRKATQLYENTVGVTVDTGHIELKGEPKVKHLKWLTCNFAGCQFRGIGLAVRKERYFSGVLFPGFAALDFTGFERIPVFTKGRKVEIVSFVTRFYGII